MPTPTSDTRLKRRLEVPLHASVRALFRAIATRLRSGLTSGGAGLGFDVRGVVGDSLRGLIRTHHGRVSDAFLGRVARGLPADLSMDDEERAEIEARLSALFDARAEQQAELVLATTQRDVARAVRVAREHVDKTDGMTLANVPALAANVFQARALARARSIATFETQAAAEATKTVEALVLSGLLHAVEVKAAGDALEGMPPEPEKVWRSQGDSRVRTGQFDHLEADGQRRSLSELYEVSGEELLHPGDTSHGASLGNVIGCRCDSAVDVDSVAQLRRFFLGLGMRPDRRVIRPTESDPANIVTMPFN